MMTRTKKLEIVKYALETMEFEDDTIKTITEKAKINVMAMIEALDRESLEAMIKDNQVTRGEALLLLRLKSWCAVYRISNTTLPPTIEEWKEKFTQEGFDKFINKFAVTTKKKDNPPKITGDEDVDSEGETTQSTRLKTMKIAIKMADFPEFNGTHSTWYTFKQDFEAMVELAGMSDVLQTTNMDEHESLMETDQEYQDQVETLYRILKKKTSKGTALSMIKKFQANKDGVMAWRYLKEYYDQEGDKDIYGSKCMTDLFKLRLTYSSFGGMDKYLSDFDMLCQQLEEADQGLTDRQKKTFLLAGIEDEDYNATKEICGELNYTKTVMTLRRKAAQLGKIFKPKSRTMNKVIKRDHHRNKNHKQN